MWNPGFAFDEVRAVSVVGWARRLWQGSTDHRGTPEYPGVVCTLVACPGESCRGLAYAVSAAAWEELRPVLDYREKDGYQLQELITDAGLSMWSYVARPDNPSYLGQPSSTDLAARIARAQGPSGTSLDYFRRLRAHLHQMGVREGHLEELAELLGE